MKKIFYFIALTLCCTACSEDLTNYYGTSSSSSYATISFENRSENNTYSVTLSDGTTFSVPKGTTKTCDVKPGYYSITAVQKTGYVEGHAQSYTWERAYLEAGSKKNHTFPDFGNIVIKNSASSTFSATINGGKTYQLSGGQSVTLNKMDVGYYSVYCVQQNGYFFYPTTKTITGTLQSSHTLTFTIKN